MKRKIIGLIIIINLLILPIPVKAAPPDIAGGVNNEHTYSELVFVSGQAIKFSGDCKVTEKDRDTLKTISCKFSLTPEDKSIKGKLERKVNYEISYTKYSDKGQTIGQGTIKSYSETITLDKDKYTLEDYQYSQSDVIDNRPASDFYSGTLKARKTYALNKNEGQVIIEISGGDVGYDNFWGSTETQLLDYTLDAYRNIVKDTKTSRVTWQGTVKVIVSDSTSKTLQYDDNQANLSSFSGGHMRITRQEMISKYDFDLPVMIAATSTSPSVPDSVRRNRNVMELSQQMLPRIERLIIPKFRDTGGHWAEEDIKQLYSLDVFAGNSQFFLPNVPMTRLDFIRAVVKATDMRPKQTSKSKSTARKTVTEVSLFKDIKTTHSDYQYAKEALEKGIISASPQQLFMPDNPLTRAQAITILVKALGFESKAPTPGYVTSFIDDSNIPAWSRDSIYVAREIGLINGDSLNRVNPERVMTRAEASAMLNKFLDFLQRDLQKDYCDNIILYN